MHPGIPARNLRDPRRFFALGLLAFWAAAAASGRVVELTVLATTDMHGSIRRTPDVYVEHNDGSLLQCATIIRQVRGENPNTLLVDSGDIFQGTAESWLTKGGIMARAMNALGYDAFAVGNHEFDWGVDVLAEILEQVDAVPLAANLLADETAPTAFGRVLPYTLREVDGLRVALVGLTTPNLSQWTRGLKARGLRTLNSRRALERTLPEVRKAKPHILILLVHQGLQARDDDANQIKGIGRRFGEFDLVLGGHLHWVLAGTRIGRVDYAQAGSGARGVLRIDLTYDTVQGAVTGKRFDYLPVSEDTPEDPELAALVAEDLAEADRWLDTVIGRTEGDLTASVGGAGLSPVQQLLSAAIAEGTEAEVVLHGVLSNRAIPAGDIRMADVWRIVPYENTVGCAWLNAAGIRAIMEEAVGYLGTDRYFGAWGLQYELHAYAEAGHRIRNLRTADGQPLHARRRLKVALNSYQLAGGGGRFPVLARVVREPNARLAYVDQTTREMVADYIRRHPALSIPAGTHAVLFRSEPPRGSRGKK
jgi:5'-nucleotidase / UDP-sugar diphosphatase